MKNIAIGGIILVVILLIVAFVLNSDMDNDVMDGNDNDTATTTDTTGEEINTNFEGASAVYYSDQADMVFVSSNTQSQVAMYDSALAQMTAMVGAADADGIYYNDDTQMLYQVNRTENQIDVYEWDGMELTFVASSPSGEFINGRELAVMGDTLVVAQDANDDNANQNALVVFEINGNAVDYVGTHNVDINLWGIRSAGNDLHAIVDNSNNVAVFAGFFDIDHSTSSALAADTTISVEGLTRTHGLDYDAENDLMILTDIGSADSDSDGALVLVYDFMDAAADGTVQLSEQIRATGAETMLGNPVDVALNYDAGLLYVAERANGGGQLLTFALPAQQ